MFSSLLIPFLPIDSTRYVSTKACVRLGFVSSSTHLHSLPWAFQKQRFVLGSFCWHNFSLIVVLLPSVSRPRSWKISFLSVLRSVTQAKVCTVCFILKTDQILYTIPASDFVHNSTYSFQLDLASSANRLCACCILHAFSMSGKPLLKHTWWHPKHCLEWPQPALVAGVQTCSVESAG